MSDLRIYEIARELNIRSADLLEICSSLGIDVKSHSSSVTAAQKKAIVAAVKNSRKKEASGERKTKDIAPKDRKAAKPNKATAGERAAH